MILLEPTIADKEQVAAYRASFLENNEIIHGSSGLENAESIEKWLELQEAYKSPATVPAGHVPSRVYLAKEANQVVGILNLRLELNNYLLQYGGHIGYSVKKSFRQKGYATAMLAQSLPLARSFGLEKVLVTCDEKNLASAKVIEKNGGQLEDIRIDPTDGSSTRRYWLSTNQ
ncbi:GNAT family N-acetyltransferase [Enterococcus sp.]|jgi:predicted acetyltransferase|uniref:GNAT family N-acetyltransferase n=1 Tax=Enterococcus sp. TaxID=35783 RepID=UPI0025BF5115|nr:GNAT family N-acetyltransferase [Enterococcus sp.]